MTTTARLDLPLIAPQQAQKHVTHNEALLVLDALVQPVLREIGATMPPDDPEAGAAYGIGAGASGAWDGRDGAVAVWTQGGWRFADPEEGWLVWDAGSGGQKVFADGAWHPASRNLALCGVNTPADETNRLAVRSEAALITAIAAGDGGSGDVRLTLNKETTADSATLLFQSGWSGRAEIGLAGNDDLALKVSPDGTQFTTAMSVSGGEGFVAFHRVFGAAPNFPVVAAGTLLVETGHAVPAPESGSSDSIETIAGGFDGALLVVTGTAGVTLTFRAGIGNLRLGGDRVLDDVGDSLLLVRRGADWIELSYADNG